MSRSSFVSLLVCALGCGGGQQAGPSVPAGGGGGAAADPNAVYGPLEIGADYATYHKVSKQKFESPTHGHRFVDVYVNDVGLAAYTSDAPVPAGTVIVKASWENDGGKPSDVEGPIFVMEKREAGYAPEHEDWYYAIHWAHPVGKLAAQLDGPFYWRSTSAKVNYCWKCHENYDRELGQPPPDMRAWAADKD